MAAFSVCGAVLCRVSVGVGGLDHGQAAPSRAPADTAGIGELRQTDTSVSPRSSCAVGRVRIRHGQSRKGVKLVSLRYVEHFYFCVSD